MILKILAYLGVAAFVILVVSLVAGAFVFCGGYHNPVC